MLGYIAVVLAAVGHFYPVPYPESHWHLVSIVCTFFAMHWYIQYQHYFVEGSSIFFSKPSLRSAVLSTE